MVYFKSIEPTRHYLEEHEREISWIEVVKIILRTKNPRKKGKLFEIEKDDVYILFKIKNNKLKVINAKRK